MVNVLVVMVSTFLIMAENSHSTEVRNKLLLSGRRVSNDEFSFAAFPLENPSFSANITPFQLKTEPN